MEQKNSDAYQADIERSGSTEKFNRAGEWLPGGFTSLREALARTLEAYTTSIKLLGANQFAVDSDPVIIAARAALNGVPQPASEQEDAFDLEAFIEADNLEPGELRPCPFCGGEAHVHNIEGDEDDENFGGSVISCSRCGCSSAVHFDRKEHLYSSWNERMAAVTQLAKPMEMAMTEAQIKHMVDRFLSWKLPEHFSPDDGISFDPIASKGTPYEFRRAPVGTNLFSVDQATAMVRHMLEGLPPPASEAGKLSTDTEVR